MKINLDTYKHHQNEEEQTQPSEHKLLQIVQKPPTTNIPRQQAEITDFQTGTYIAFRLNPRFLKVGVLH